jgi:hypothetical protein
MGKPDDPRNPDGEKNHDDKNQLYIFLFFFQRVTFGLPVKKPTRTIAVCPPSIKGGNGPVRFLTFTGPRDNARRNISKKIAFFYFSGASPP